MSARVASPAAKGSRVDPTSPPANWSANARSRSSPASRSADVADLITYLCREESGYITGATYDVNGGAHIH